MKRRQHDDGSPRTRHSCNISVFPMLADTFDVERGDQLLEAVSQPSIQPDKLFDQWAVDRDPNMYWTTPAKLGKTGAV